MELPPISIESLPMLDTAVGMFGTLTQADPIGPSLFEVLITLVLIFFD